MNKLYGFFLKYSLIISLGIIAVAFIIFYPKTYVAVDEQNYLYNAKNIVEGTLKQTCDVKESSQFEVEGYCIYKYNIGTSFFYIPAALTSLRFAFVSTFVVFCIGIFYFNKYLKENKINPIFTLLYALFPPFVYYSRTLYSEVYSFTFILMTFYYLDSFVKSKKIKDSLFGGFLFGLSVIVRYTNFIPLIIILMGVMFRNFNVVGFVKNRNLVQLFKRVFRKFVSFFISLIPLLFFLLWFNNYLYGNPLRSGYFYSGEQGLVSFASFPGMLIKYLIILSLLYPFMLEIAFMGRYKYKGLFLTLIFVLLIFYSLFPGNNGVFEGRILDLIFGMRFLLPVIPFIMILYFKYLYGLLKRKVAILSLLIAIVFLIINVFVLSFVHQQFLKNFI